MKVKTLLLILVALTLTFVWGIPAAILGIADYLEDKGSNEAYLFFEKYAEYPTTSDIKGKFLYADSLVKSFNKYTIMLAGWGGSEDTTPENMEKAKKLLEEIMAEIPNNEDEKEYYIDSYKMLLDMAISMGDTEMLHKWISFGQENTDEKLMYTADIYNGFILHVNGDREGAKKIIEKYDKTDIADIKLDILKAEITLFDGDYDEAEKMFQKIDSNWNAREKCTFGSTGYYERSFWYDRIIKRFKGTNVVRGTVTYEGKPLPFVEIYVQEADGGLRSGGESYIGITDENGEFETLGLKNGIFDIGIGIEDSILTDKVLQRSEHRYLELDGDDVEINFIFNNTLSVNMPGHGEKISGEEFTVSWEEVAGAEYYNVEPVVFFEAYEKSGSSFRSPIADENGEDRFTETSATFKMETLRNQTGGTMYDGEERLLCPTSVLGIFMPGVEYPIVVNAYDENNNLITSSLPLRTYYEKIPSIITEGSLTEGEKLILGTKYPEAIEFYENILKDNPYDVDALRYLTKIYGIGWKEGEKNVERAITLGQRYTEISGNGELLPVILHHMDTDEIKENSEMVRSILTSSMEHLDDDKNYLLSRYYIAVEDWESARETFRNMKDYVPDDLFYLNMYFGDYKDAAENIRSKDFYISRLSSDKVEESLKALENSHPNDSDRQAFNTFLLELVKGIDYDGGETLYNETSRKITDSNIKTILHEIYLDRRWDVEY